MSKDEIRLSKLMSERDICSRREADRYIEQGLVEVNGKVVSTLGQKVAQDVKIVLRRPAQKVQGQKQTIILNKPVGFVSAQAEDGYTPAITLLTSQNHHTTSAKVAPSYKKLAVCGRLDIDSKGLLIFSQDGMIAKKLIGEHSEIEKEYVVRFQGTLNQKGLSLLQYGLVLDGQKLKRAAVSYVDQIRFPDLLRVVLKEGKKRQIRRMFELVGLKVTSLKRIRVGNIELKDLPEGKWRFLSPNETF